MLFKQHLTVPRKGRMAYTRLTPHISRVLPELSEDWCKGLWEPKAFTRFLF